MLYFVIFKSLKIEKQQQSSKVGGRMLQAVEVSHVEGPIEETLGRMRTRENEAEAAENWVSEISKATQVATDSNAACNSVTLSTIFQN